MSLTERDMQSEFDVLQLPAEDLEPLIAGLTEFNPQDVKCQGTYCPDHYCSQGYEEEV